MPGESGKVFRDPLLDREILWEQDVYCPTCTVFEDRIAAVYRAYGEDGQWRAGLAWSRDGRHFERLDAPILYGRPDDPLSRMVCRDPSQSVSYGDARIVAREDAQYVLLINVFQHGGVQQQELAVAVSRDLRHWDVVGRAFAEEAPTDRQVIPEKLPWRFPHPAVVTRFDGRRLVAAKIQGRYWMYLNCLSTVGPPCLCMAVSDDLISWRVLRAEDGSLVHPMFMRPGRFDSFYVDTTAAVIRRDGILLIYNGINEDPKGGGDPRLKQYAHYPAQALFDRSEPWRLLQRSETPFLGNEPDLERLPLVFWYAPLYESWSLVPWQGEWLLYWNHAFRRRSVGLMTTPIVPSLFQERA